jgi:hypothetical protein
MAALEQELMDQFNKLDAGQKKQVLDFMERLTQPVGEPGRDFIARTSNIHFAKEDLDEIQQYIATNANS